MTENERKAAEIRSIYRMAGIEPKEERKAEKKPAKKKPAKKKAEKDK